MFDYNEDAVFAAHRYREAQMMREVESARISREIQVEPLHRQLLAKTGDLLISAGTTLKGRADSLPASPKFRQDIRRA